MAENYPAPPYPGTPRTSKLALASLILGCLVFVLGCIPGIPAVVCGIMGLRSIDKNPGMEGKGFAIAGIILGGLSLLFIPILAALAIPAINGAVTTVKTTAELNDAKYVGVMLDGYAQEHDGKFPDNLDQLVKFLPGDKELEKHLYKDETTEYKWTLTPGLTLESPPETVLLSSTEHMKFRGKEGNAVYLISGVAKFQADSTSGY